MYTGTLLVQSQTTNNYKLGGQIGHDQACSAQVLIFYNISLHSEECIKLPPSVLGFSGSLSQSVTKVLRLCLQNPFPSSTLSQNGPDPRSLLLPEVWRRLQKRPAL